MNNFVVNIKLSHSNSNRLDAALNQLDLELSKKLKQKDHYRYYGCYYQIRTTESSLAKIIEILKHNIVEFKLEYWIVIGNGLKQTKLPLNISFCDALIESGSLFDKVVKLKRNNICVKYSFFNKKHTKRYNEI